MYSAVPAPYFFKNCQVTALHPNPNPHPCFLGYHSSENFEGLPPG